MGVSDRLYAEDVCHLDDPIDAVAAVQEAPADPIENANDVEEVAEPDDNTVAAEGATVCTRDHKQQPAAV